MSGHSNDRSDAVVSQGVLGGLSVVEFGRFAAAPSCATLLADWGAQVIKLESPQGDPARGPGSTDSAAVPNPRFDVHNRSRRSLALDLKRDDAVAAAHRLIETADVMITNLRPTVLERLRMDSKTLLALNPRLVYGHITGYGYDTDRADVRSYDHGAFWAYTGVGHLFAGPDGEPPQPAGGLGDRASGGMLAAGILAALLARVSTGVGEYVATSLVSTGLWLVASDASDALVAGEHRATDRLHPPIPTVNCFRTLDGHWIWLQVMQPAEHWASLLHALDAAWLDEDPRFRNGSAKFLNSQATALVEVLDEIFGQRTMAEWGERLDRCDLTWAPVRTLDEAVTDQRNHASHTLRTIRTPGGGTYQAINSPCTFGSEDTLVGYTAPRAGEHNAAILRELGYSPNEIEFLTGAAEFPEVQPRVTVEAS